MSDADEETEAPATSDGQQRTVPAGAFVIAVMVAMALAVLSVVALATAGGGDGDDDQEVRVAAGRFAERFLTFEHDGLDDWKADVLRLSTGGFASEVEDVESGLRALISESELDAVTQVTDIFVGEVERGAAEVVIVYDRDLRGGQQARSEADRYMQLAMVRVDGEWLVDNVLDIATAGGLQAPGPALEGGEEAPTSSTSVPDTDEDG